MRKEKLFALALAGILAVSSAPAVFAAEADPTGVEDSSGDQEEAADSENPEGEETGNTEEEEPTEEGATDPDEGDASKGEQKKEESESAVTPNTEDVTNGGISQPLAESSTKANDTTSTVPVVKTAADLQNEINKLASVANKTGEIQVNADFALDKTITIPEGTTVTLSATGKAVTLSRASGFKGAMFEVKGALNLNGSTAENKNEEANLTINGSLKEGEAEGSILDVSGSLTVNELVKLTGNKTSAKVKGGAIHNTGKPLYIKGGSGGSISSITGNTSDNGGAIYSEAKVIVSGLVKIEENHKRDSVTDNNIEIKKGNILSLDGAIKNSKIFFHIDSDVAVGDTVVSAKRATQLENAVNNKWLNYEGQSGVTLGVDGTIKRATIEADVNTYTTLNKKSSYKLGESIEYEVIGAGYPGTTSEITAPQDGDVRWRPLGFSGKSANDDFTSFDTETGKYLVEGLKIPATYSSDKANVFIQFAKETFEDGKWVENMPTVTKVVTDTLIVNTKEVVDPSGDPGVVSEVEKKDCKITGLKESYKKGTAITFKAVGAGMDNDSPQEGAVRWVPLKYGIDGGKEYSFEAEDGEYAARISTSSLSVKDYKVYAIFQKQVYNNGQWVDAGEDEIYTISQEVSITKATPTATPTKRPGKNPTSTPKGSNTKKASNTKTGDESPILPLTVLCMASLATGGYVLVRRRKKSEN